MSPTSSAMAGGSSAPGRSAMSASAGRSGGWEAASLTPSAVAHCGSCYRWRGKAVQKVAVGSATACSSMWTIGLSGPLLWPRGFSSRLIFSVFGSPPASGRWSGCSSSASPPERKSRALRISSLYIYGRYRKLIRGIPQTEWPCRKCKGRGCEGCNFTGKQYPESVEELIAPPLVNAAQASSFCLHGAGREDIDARMLGEGRPFVMELISPRVRSLDLAKLRDAVNRDAEGKVEVSSLSFVDRSLVASVKETSATKRYRVKIEFASLAGGLGVQAKVTALDVLAVISPDFPDVSWGDLNMTSLLT